MPKSLDYTLLHSSMVFIYSTGEDALPVNIEHNNEILIVSDPLIDYIWVWCYQKYFIEFLPSSDLPQDLEKAVKCPFADPPKRLDYILLLCSTGFVNL